MNISTRDKKILLMFMGVFLLAVSYLFVYRPQMEEAERIEQENGPLSERLAELLDMAKNRKMYEEEIQKMQKEIWEYCQEFPKTVRAEDGIVLARDMEKETDSRITEISLGVPELLATLDGSQAEGEDQERETLSKQADDRVKESLKGLDEEEAQAVEQVFAQIQEALQPTLYRTQDKMQLSCTYEGLKALIRYLASGGRKRNLDTLNASYDSATGNLIGSVTVNLFSMSGAGSGYTSPDGGTVEYGTDNIFGTIERTMPGSGTGEAAQNVEGES